MGPKSDNLRIVNRIPRKWIFIFLANICIAIIYGLKVNMSLAIVTMIDSSHPVQESECGAGEEKEDLEIAGHKFDWTADIEGYILSSYFYGYLIGQIPFALLADFTSAKWVNWAVTVVNIVGCVVTPLAARPHWGVLVMVRIIQGLGGAASFPVMHILIANWSAPEERSIFSGVIYGGTAIGMIGSTLIAGFVSLALGWENMFYIMGALCVPWVFLWAWLITDFPPERASEDVFDVRENWRYKVKTFPVKAVFTSLPFWAIMVAHFGGNCGLYCLITQVPSFMKKVLHKDIKENTSLSVIPYVVMIVVSVVAGVVFDKLRSKKLIDTTLARRLGSSISMGITAVCLIGVTFIGCDSNYGILCIAIATGATGAQTVGYLSNHIDISPRFAGLLMAITNTVATIPGITIPSVFGQLTHSNNTLRQWSYGFYGIAIILVICYIFYMIFVSGELQPWNDPETMQAGEGKPADEAAPAEGAAPPEAGAPPPPGAAEPPPAT